MSSKDDGSNKQMIYEKVNSWGGGEVGNAIAPTYANFENSLNSRSLLPRINHTDQCEEDDYQKKRVSHNYHDHSQDPLPADGERELSFSKGGVTEPFPLKLHRMLTKVEDEGNEHIVSWQPHGRCFLVRDNLRFVENVLPRHFSQKKLASFQRQLNLYGFCRITAGTDKGSYYHECFLRGKEFLIKRISRYKIKGTGARLPGNPDQEPNFYSMPFLDKIKSKSDDDNGDDGKREESTNLKETATEDLKIIHKEASTLDIEPIYLSEISGPVASVAATPVSSNTSNIRKDDCKPSSLLYSATNSATRPNKRRNALDLQHSERISTNSTTRSNTGNTLDLFKSNGLDLFKSNGLDLFKSNGISSTTNPLLAGTTNNTDTVSCTSFLHRYKQQQHHQHPTSYAGISCTNNSSNNGNLSDRNKLLVDGVISTTSQLHRDEQQQYQQPARHEEAFFRTSTSQRASERLLPHYSSQSLHGNNIGNGEIASTTIDQHLPKNNISFDTSVGRRDASFYHPSSTSVEYPLCNDTSSSSDSSDGQNDSALDITEQLAFVEEMELIQSLGESNVSEEELGKRLGKLINM